MAQYKKENDPHREIQAQALADRIVEAFAEVVHKEMRTVSSGCDHPPLARGL